VAPTDRLYSTPDVSGSRPRHSELCARLFRIEYRYPMLDLPLVELAYNLPPHLKMHHGTERYQIRRLLEGVTTQRIQWRRKADVNHPLRDHQATFRAAQQRLLRQVEGSDTLQRYLDPERLKRENEEVGFTAARIERLARQMLGTL
jgi:asparagine synthase (glutamine-hydrolysing)